LSNEFVFCIHEDREGALWIGTWGGGLNRLDKATGTFSHFTTADGLASNEIYGILEDPSRNLWLMTNEGLTRFSPRTQQFRNYEVSDGLQSKEFISGSFYQSPSGEMFFGGANGFNAFYPQNIFDNGYVPPVLITSFKVLNKEVKLAKPIWETDEIVLSPKDYLFSLEFAALDYTAPERNRYAYKLEGLTPDWLYTDARHRQASFSRLPPGRYVFRVKGSNSDGIWNEQATSLVIQMRGPWWRSWWFLSLMAAAVFLLLFQWNRTRFKRLAARIRTEAAMDQFFNKFNISTREKEITILLLKGKTNNEIEDLLFIELSTVKNHIHNIFKKLGIKNRAQLLRLFQNLQIK
jgi:two-component system sensor histidine kinase ChiS